MSNLCKVGMILLALVVCSATLPAAADDQHPVTLTLRVVGPAPVAVGDILTVETVVCIPTGTPPDGQTEILLEYTGYWSYDMEKLQFIGNTLAGFHYTVWAIDDPGIILQVYNWDMQPEFARWINLCYAPQLVIGRIDFRVIQAGHMVFTWLQSTPGLEEWTALYTVGRTVNLVHGLNNLTFDLDAFRGDMNADGIVNAQDIDQFLAAVTDAPGYLALHGFEPLQRADTNWDGSVNSQDIDGFIALLFGGA